MTDLKSQRRMAADILNVGESRVWLDPDAIGEIELAVTKEDIRKLIKERKVWKKPPNPPSRHRARDRIKKRRKGRKKGYGSRKGSKKARGGETWVTRIRSLRKLLKKMRDREIISPKTYQKLRGQAKASRFRGKRDLKRFIKDQELNEKPLEELE